MNRRKFLSRILPVSAAAVAIGCTLKKKPEPKTLAPEPGDRYSRVVARDYFSLDEDFRDWDLFSGAPKTIAIWSGRFDGKESYIKEITNG